MRREREREERTHGSGKIGTGDSLDGSIEVVECFRFDDSRTDL